MAAASRARISLDPKGLGPQIHAHANARGMTVSAFMRMSMARMLDGAVGVESESADDSRGVADESVKLTVRMPRRIAREVSMRAQAAGLSNGVYLSSLIDGVPLPSATAHADAVQALAASTDQLAVAVADLNAFARQIRHAVPASAEAVDGAAVPLAREVRTHLALASRLIAELTPIAVWRHDAGVRVRSHRAAL